MGKHSLAVALLEKVKEKTGAVDFSGGSGLANTAFAYHAGRLLALHEGDLPYAIRCVNLHAGKG